MGVRRIRRLVNTDHGIQLDVECYCGRRVLVVTGRGTLAGRDAVAA